MSLIYNRVYWLWQILYIAYFYLHCNCNFSCCHFYCFAIVIYSIVASFMRSNIHCVASTVLRSSLRFVCQLLVCKPLCWLLVHHTFTYLYIHFVCFDFCWQSLLHTRTSLIWPVRWGVRQYLLQLHWGAWIIKIWFSTVVAVMKCRNFLLALLTNSSGILLKSQKSQKTVVRKYVNSRDFTQIQK